MSKLTKTLSISMLILFVLACNFVTQPVRDVQRVAETAQSFATALPVETIQAFASQVVTQVSQETIEALPSSLPDFGNFFDPQGTPVEVWNEIPIMPGATVGQEFDGGTYSFKIGSDVSEIQTFYSDKLKELGWSETFSIPADTSGAVMVFSKGDNILTITIAANTGDQTVVMLTKA